MMFSLVTIPCQFSNQFPVIDNMPIFEHEHPFSYRRIFAYRALLVLLELKVASRSPSLKILKFSNFFEINNFQQFLFLNALIEKTSNAVPRNTLVSDWSSRGIKNQPRGSTFYTRVIRQFILHHCIYRCINAILTISLYRSVCLTELS